MLMLYKTGTIKATPRFRKIIITAIGAIFITYILSFILSLFNLQIFNFINSNGPIGIIFSLIVVGIAAFTLILDFDFIQKGAQARLPGYMEWYGAFGLMVTLIWLYFELLRLLSKFYSRN
jgi:uncharacterized YccA/Bax inhibitor family protein